MTATVTVDTILVQDNEALRATVDDNAVVLSIRAGAYFSFNGVGTKIWNMLVEPREVGQILDLLAQSHDTDRDTMARDVTTFLERLIERRLIRVVPPDQVR